MQAEANSPALSNAPQGAQPTVAAFFAEDDRFFAPLFKRVGGVTICHVKQFKTIVKQTGGGDTGPLHFGSLVCYNRKLSPTDKMWLPTLVAEGFDIVAGPEAAEDPFAWEIKSWANSRGRIFEIVESKKIMIHTLASAIGAIAARHALSRGSPRAEPTQRETVAVSPSRPTAPTKVTEDALATLPGIVEATQFLRSSRGRLDAEKVRELFQLSRSDLARLAGTSGESLRQTPDSERVQPVLKQLERCARLLVLNPDPANFRTWLQTENSEFDGLTPLHLIEAGKAEVVAVLVQDILTNRGR